LAAAPLGADGVGPHLEHGGAAGGLGQNGIIVGGALHQDAALPQTDPDGQQRERKVVGDVFEVVADLHSPVVLPMQEVQIVDFTDHRSHNHAVDLR
jgi:hypothetical protein